MAFLEFIYIYIYMYMQLSRKSQLELALHGRLAPKNSARSACRASLFREIKSRRRAGQSSRHGG